VTQRKEVLQKEFRKDMSVLQFQKWTATVTMPTPLRFDAPHATCNTQVVDVTPPQPLTFSRAEQRRQEVNHQYESRTSCESFNYVINGAADPETREVIFNRACKVCVIGRPPADLAEQKQRTLQTIQAMSQISPMAGGIAGAIIGTGENAAAIAEKGEGPTQPDNRPGYTLMSWGDLDRALNAVQTGGGRPPEVPELMMVRGTVSRVEVSTPSPQHTQVDVSFREMPDQRKFTACASSTDDFEQLFDPDFRTRMVAGRSCRHRGFTPLQAARGTREVFASASPTACAAWDDDNGDCGPSGLSTQFTL
jgi:hypothetical protein